MLCNYLFKMSQEEAAFVYGHADGARMTEHVLCTKRFGLQKAESPYEVVLGTKDAPCDRSSKNKKRIRESKPWNLSWFINKGLHISSP